MIKIIGLVMIIGSSGFLGSYIYKTLKNRCEILKDMLSAIDILQAEIVFKRSDLSSSIAAVMKRMNGSSKVFWENIGHTLSGGGGTDKAFSDALEAIKTKGITKEDSEIIRSLSGVLGRYDSLEQAQMLKNIKEIINLQWLESTKELKEKGKLYRALGVSFGIVIALVVI